jgi:hypothetical protein
MLTADQIAEFRRVYSPLFESKPGVLLEFNALCEQAATRATLRDALMDGLNAERDRWRDLAERLGEALKIAVHCDHLADAALAELRAMQT